MDTAKAHPTDRAKEAAGAGPDDLGLSVADAPRGGRAHVLAAQLRAAVQRGALSSGDRLPPTRLLAEQLGVSRGVVSEAYARLADEGLVAGRGRGGTVVTAVPVVAPAPGTPGAPAAGSDSGAAPAGGLVDGLAAPADNAGFDRFRALPARVDLTPGRPDLTAFPRAAWLRAEREVLDGAAATELGYGDPQGHPRLRAAVARWLARTRGLPVDPDALVVVAGVAQSLSLLAQLLRRDGRDRIAVEDPGSLGARHQLEAWGLTTLPAPVDGDGLLVDALPDCDAVMVTPAHQFPTGVSLSGERRRALLDWAREHDALVVEDDYDAEHRYDRHPVPALASTAPDRVHYAGSISKLLAPALRIGWTVPPPALRADVVALKRETDLGNPTLAQLVLAVMLERGDLERHLRTVRRRHRARRDALLAGLSRHLDPDSVLGIAAGLHLTIRLPDAVDDVALAVRLLEEHGIKAQPLSWHRRLLGPPGLVLGYATTSGSLLAEAGEVIGAAAVTPPRAAPPSARSPRPATR